MFPAHIISFNNGWNILSQEKPSEWQGIQEALLEITPEVLNRPSQYVVDGQNIVSINEKLAMLYIDSVWDYFIRKKGWGNSTSRVTNKNESEFFIDNLKNKVHASLLGGPRVDDEINKFVFVTSQRSYKWKICDVCVALLPTDSVVEAYDSKETILIDYMFSEANSRKHIDDVMHFNINVPIVFVFFGINKSELSIEQVPIVRIANTIERSIEFQPEYYQAGVGILSYFGEVLRQNYPNVNAKVRIEQDGNIVRMHVESPAGDIEIIERELEKYALVISNQATPESLFDNRAYIMRLEHKLEVTKLEVKQANDMLLLTRDLTSQRVNNLEEQVSTLRQQIGAQLLQTGQIIDLAQYQVASNERVQLAQIGHAHTLFKDLLGEAHGNQILLTAIRSLEYNLMSGIATIDVQEQVKESLSVMKQQNPGLLARFAAQTEGAGYGALAGTVIEWLKQHAQ